MLKIINLFVLIFIILLINPSPSISQIISVKSDGTQVFSGPATHYSIKWQFNKGFPVKSMLQKKNWIKVEDFENDTGWIQKDNLCDQPMVIVKPNKNTDEKINIRQGPGSSYKVIGKAFYGVVFKKIDQKGDWIKVQHESGFVGWVSDTLLWGLQH